MALDREAVIARLNEDLALEHAAIIQYIGHAFALREGQIPREIEDISREEMRHFKWFFEKIVELGGVPTLERAEILKGDTPREMLDNDVHVEGLAIEKYRQDALEIDDPEIVALIERVLVDEEAHRREFSEMAEEMPPELTLPAQDGPPSPQAAHAAALLNEDLQVEYTTVLRYLRQAFTTPDAHVGWEIDQRSQEEMKHMERLAERIVDFGGEPVLEHSDIADPGNDLDILERESRGEQRTVERYRLHQESIDDPETRELLDRIIAEEEYHQRVFDRLAESLQPEKEDTLMKEQVEEQTLAVEQAGQAPTEPAFQDKSGPEQEMLPEEQPAAPQPEAPRLTVGSLFGRPQS